MTKERAKAKTRGKPKAAPAPVWTEGKSPDQLSITRIDGNTSAELLAETTLSPIVRNAAMARTFGDEYFSRSEDRSDLDRCVALVASKCGKVRAGNLDDVTDMLTAQMATMDALFSVALQRAASNMGRYPEAVDRYMNMAMKAQAGCRTTAETLARIKRGGKQTVKVIHVHQGGQAVVADTVNTGGRAGVGRQNDEQVHEQSAQLAALPGPDPEGLGVPMSGFEGQEAVPVAWGDEHRGAEG